MIDVEKLTDTIIDTINSRAELESQRLRLELGEAVKACAERVLLIADPLTNQIATELVQLATDILDSSSDETGNQG